MMKPYMLLIALAFAFEANAQEKAGPERIFNLNTYQPHADGRTDDTPAFLRLFEDVGKQNGGTVTIPPGEYYLEGEKPLPIPSNTIVSAYGASFFLPETLGDQARIVLFQGTDIVNFSWFGGHFKGHVFDHRNPPNTWEPNVTTRVFVINTSRKGTTDRLTFRDVGSDGIAGSVINVEGLKASESEVVNFATNITVENCTLINSGKFMWDYGLLWQILVFPEDYSAADIAMAQKYFRNDLIRENLKIPSGSDRIFLNNKEKEIETGETICLFGDDLPSNILKGKQYYVTEAAPGFIKISETAEGAPLVFDGAAGEQAKLIFKLRSAFLGLYAPLGAGPGKGCIDLVGCRNTRVSGCKISALGDAMHIHSSHNNVFSGNQILGARMGAFFLAEFCKNSTIIGNTVDGTNGSRVVSIEKSNEDVTVIGNTFRNGGRGSWINQPKNLIMQGNIFINNTTKGENDPWRGRRSYKTGELERYPEIYFTTYEADGQYGPVILRDNIFQAGPEAAAAVVFEKNGKDVLVEGNIFKGSTGLIIKDKRDTAIVIGENMGATVRTNDESSGVRFGN